ncbi:transposase [Desulfovibrio sp.]|uniref:transposase n=1 Tax=Desulfovibrio sp. TaxID=885 RepID=UPI00345BA441
MEALGEVYPSGRWQRYTVHFYRNALHAEPRGKAADVASSMPRRLRQMPRRSTILSPVKPPLA